eukprot:CAMPEP_0177675932 /NCGR_PEP_ID=MMETSP0447-20121125/27489_1 /TAXON_ID=0 /ORGANISM="Stygamoeba regulata, Strain BSH-02190019" /LENGTH=422 /DNA_ID=CAMNT_0019184401 /DNA_START=183 /DNA_END=1448 /DNA_ORIENTATION=-
MPLMVEGYSILGDIGEGRNQVVLARTTSGDHRVLKIVHKRAGFLRNCRIYNEAQVLQILKHPNVVKFHGFHESSECSVLELEYIPSGDLIDYLQSRDMSEKTAKKIFSQLVLAVNYLHKKGYVHRDIKGDNIILRREDDPVLIDFEFCSKYNNKKKTLQTVVGSYQYSSPEMLRREVYYGPEVDMWSLGVTLYTMLFSELPWNGKKVSDHLALISSQPLTFPKNRGKVSSTAKHLLSRLLTVDPSKRATMTEILLHDWIADTPAVRNYWSCIHQTPSPCASETPTPTPTPKVKAHHTKSTGSPIGSPQSTPARPHPHNLSQILVQDTTGRTVSEHCSFMAYHLLTPVPQTKQINQVYGKRRNSTLPTPEVRRSAITNSMLRLEINSTTAPALANAVMNTASMHCSRSTSVYSATTRQAGGGR